jgi:hypothetical protein
LNISLGLFTVDTLSPPTTTANHSAIQTSAVGSRDYIMGQGMTLKIDLKKVNPVFGDQAYTGTPMGREVIRSALSGSSSSICYGNRSPQLYTM